MSSSTVDNAEIEALRDEITRLHGNIHEKELVIIDLIAKRTTAYQYAQRLDYLLSTLSEESVDLRIVADALQNVLSP